MRRADTPTHAPEPPPFSQGAQTVHGCGDPDDVTRRQGRHIELFDRILGEEQGEEEAEDEGQDHGSPPAAVSAFEAARAKIERRVNQLFARLADGSLDVVADEL